MYLAHEPIAVPKALILKVHVIPKFSITQILRKLKRIKLMRKNITQ